MSKDKGKGPDEPTPQAKGGRRSKRPMTDVRMKNLKPWKPGQSGNPAGQPKSVVEIAKMAREMTPALLERLYKIATNEFGDVPYRDQNAAIFAIVDRGSGRAAIGIFHGTGPGVPPGFVEEGTDDGTALLLRAAAMNADEKTLAALKDAQRRLEAKLAQEEQAKEDHLANAAAAMARGEDVPGLTRLLLNAKAASAANAERRAAAAPPPRQPRLESKPDVFIADSSGNIAAPATVESAPLESEPSSMNRPRRRNRRRSEWSRTRRRRPRRREAPRRSPRILVLTFLASVNF